MSDKTHRPCATDQDWEKMNLEEKVETLVKWAKLMEEWAVQMHQWTTKVKGVMLELNQNGHGIVQATKDFAVKSGNGGPPPPKHPKDPHC